MPEPLPNLASSTHPTHPRSQSSAWYSGGQWTKALARIASNLPWLGYVGYVSLMGFNVNQQISNINLAISIYQLSVQGSPHYLRKELKGRNQNH